MKFADMHIHSSFSDGTDDAKALFEKLAENDISIFSVTDHDTVDFYKNLNIPVPKNMKLIPGIEFSCNMEGTQCHILGYGVDVKSDEIFAAIESSMLIRKQKLTCRIEYLEKEFGIKIPSEDLIYLSSLKICGKPHIGKVLIKNGYADTITEAISKYLINAPDKSSRIDVNTAIRAINSAGGIPVWAHPLGGEGEEHLGREKLEKTLDGLLGYGICAMECFYSRYTEKETEMLLSYADRYGLLVSGGSDYHGKNKNIALRTLCSDCRDVSSDGLTILSALGC